MSNLILSVIAITLVAATVLVGVFYGGEMFSSYQAEANASRLISEGEQIAGTVSVYANEQHVLPDDMTSLVDKNYFMEAPAQGNYTEWHFSRGYAVNEIGTGRFVHQSCLSARKQFGFDARKYCADAAAAGCAASATVSPDGCNKHCLRTCYDQENRAMWNPYLSMDDPCCIDNSDDMTMTDPVFPQ